MTARLWAAQSTHPMADTRRIGCRAREVTLAASGRFVESLKRAQSATRTATIPFKQRQGGHMESRADRGAQNFTARSFETLAANHPLLFPAPYADLPGASGYELPWRYLTYVFDLPAPASFPPITPSAVNEGDRGVLHRYISAARELAEGSFLRLPIGFSIKFSKSGPTLINRDFPTPEVVRGFCTLFRQFYSDQEKASFSAARKVIGRANSIERTETSAIRAEHLKKWRSAAGQLRAYQLNVLVGFKLQKEGRWHSAELPGERNSPSSLIALYNYGNDIHWGDRREEVEALGREPSLDAFIRAQFFDSVSGLAHLYLGFSLLVSTALGNPPPAGLRA